MKKIIDYYIVNANSKRELSATVAKFIAQGWQPYGQYTTISYALGYEYAQTMVKYED